jgi:hypothetical protein
VVEFSYKIHLDKMPLKGRGVIIEFRVNEQKTGAHPASYPRGTRDSFPGTKSPGRESYHSPTSSTKIVNVLNLALIPAIM